MLQYDAELFRNDILRKHGIIPEKPPSPTAELEEALTEARRLAHEHRLEGKDLDELAELEDDEDEDFLEQYRFVIRFTGEKEFLLTAQLGRNGLLRCLPLQQMRSIIRCILYRSRTIREKSPRRRPKRMCSSCSRRPGAATPSRTSWKGSGKRWRRSGET